MDIIGHLAVLEHAGVAGAEVWEDDAVLALFPNLAHCHEWAYKTLRQTIEAQPDEPEPGRATKLIEGHIITDWVIHYGPDLTPKPHKIGWAYQEMHLATERMDEFIDRALALGLSDNDPRDHDTREHLERDFGHTSVECALDFKVGRHVANTARETGLRKSLARLADPTWAAAMVTDVMAETGGYTREDEPKLSRTMSEYGAWADQIRHPEDFAALTICTRFNWDYDRRTVDYVLDYLHDIERDLRPGLAEELVDQVVSRIANPRLLTPA